MTQEKPVCLECGCPPKSGSLYPWCPKESKKIKSGGYCEECYQRLLRVHSDGRKRKQPGL